MTRTSLLASPPAFGAVAAAFLVGAAQAGPYGADQEGGKVRIALAADLRSSTETVLLAACRAGAGGDVAAYEGAVRDFDTILAGLRAGDAALGVFDAERSARLIRRMDRVEAAWAPLRGELGRMATGAAAAQAAAEAQAALAAETEALLSDMSGRYADAQEITKTDALRLQFLKRQTMLLERMDRVVCAIEAGWPELGSTEELAAAVDLFDLSLVALRDGMPASGVAPPRFAPVAEILAETHDKWSSKRKPFDGVAKREAGAAEAARASEGVSAELSREMHNAFTLERVMTPGQIEKVEAPIRAYVAARLAALAADPVLIDAVAAQNAAHADMTPEDVAALDAAWQAGDARGEALIEGVMARPVSKWLLEQQRAAGGYLTEIIAMDAHGLNAGLSLLTSDYWQGDEPKWQETYLVPERALHIGEVEFDDSTMLYQVEASLPLRDPATGDVIGAIAFAVDIGRLF